MSNPDPELMQKVFELVSQNQQTKPKRKRKNNYTPEQLEKMRQNLEKGRKKAIENKRKRKEQEDGTYEESSPTPSSVESKEMQKSEPQREVENEIKEAMKEVKPVEVKEPPKQEVKQELRPEIVETAPKIKYAVAGWGGYRF